MRHTAQFVRYHVLAALVSSLLLAGCDDAAHPGINIVGSGQASLSGMLVQGEGQPAVPGSRVRLYLAGDHSRSVGQTETSADGAFAFDKVPAGSYDLTFSAPGHAASELLGAAARDGLGWNYTVQQRLVRDPAGVLSVPKLVLTRPGVQQPLMANGPLNVADRLSLQVETAPNSEHQRPLLVFDVSILTPDSAGHLAEFRPAGGHVTPDVQQSQSGSGPLDLGVGSVAGDAAVQVAATDFNNNRVAQLLPVKIAGSAGGTVVAPENLLAAAYTWAAPESGLRAQAVEVQASTVNSTVNLRVQLAWTMPSLSGVRGFEIWRAGGAVSAQTPDAQPSGPWSRVALSDISDCAGSVCRASDASASLKTGQDYFYTVVAVGQNSAESALEATHTLPSFQPSLISPAAGAAEVSTSPVYTLRSPAMAIGATGSSFDLLVQDDLLGSGTPWKVEITLRTVLGQNGSSVPDHQVLFQRNGRAELAYSDLTPANNLPGVMYDAATEQITLTHNFDGAGRALQPARRSRWTLGRSSAFRLQDPTLPPSAANPVVAYSVYSDPTLPGPQYCPAQTTLPGGPCLDTGRALEFTTGAGQ